MCNWLNFEKIIERIYESIAPNAIVKHNDSVKGRDSGIYRQIDVSIRFKEVGSDFLVIVQARDYKKPADVNVIGEFASVVKDVGASKGVLICNAGFTSTAKTMAKNLGIDLCSAHDAEIKNWRTTLLIPVLWERLTPHVQFSLHLNLEPGDSISENVRGWVLSTDKGKTKLDLIGTFVNKWNCGEIPKNVGQIHNIITENQNIHVLVNTNKWAEVDKFACSYIVKSKIYRKEVGTQEFTGLKNFLTGNIEISKLSIEIPKLSIEDGWEQVNESLTKLINKERLIVTVKQLQIDQDDFIVGRFGVSKID